MFIYVVISEGISKCNSGGISGGNSEDWMAEQKPLAKVVDFVPMGAISGPGSPDGSRFGSVSYEGYNNGTPMEHTKFIEIPLVLLTG